MAGTVYRAVPTQRPCGSLVRREIELMRHLDEESAKYAAAREAGDFDIAAVIAGEAVGLIHDIPSADYVIERVVHEAWELLTRWPPQVLDR